MAGVSLSHNVLHFVAHTVGVRFSQTESPASEGQKNFLKFEHGHVKFYGNLRFFRSQSAVNPNGVNVPRSKDTDP